MKNKVLAAAFLIVLTALSSCGKKTEQIRMATGGSTGAYHTFGTAVVKALAEKTGISFTIQSTGASMANIQLIDEGKVEIAIVQNDVMDYAWNGTDLFNGEKIESFSAVAGLYAEHCQIIASPASGISGIADLRGKTISVGDAGSGTEFNARQILASYDIGFNEITRQNLNFLASADALRDNRIDAFFCVAGSPTPAIMDLAASKEILILEIDDAHAAALIRSYPFYTQQSIPAGTYRGQAAPVNTVSVKAAFIAGSGLSEDIVYRFTKGLFESKAEIEDVHIRGIELSASYAIDGISVPFHPGAAKYYREIGALR